MKILLESRPIVAIESVEEVRAVRLVRDGLCGVESWTGFEWDDPSGPRLSWGSEVGEIVPEGPPSSDLDLGLWRGGQGTLIQHGQHL